MRFQPSTRSNYGAEEEALACTDDWVDCCHGWSGTLWWAQPRCYGVTKKQCRQWEIECQEKHPDEDFKPVPPEPEPGPEPDECTDTWTDCEGMSGWVQGWFPGWRCYGYRTKCNCDPERGRNEDGTCKRPPFYQQSWFAPTMVVGGLAITVAIVKGVGQKKLISALRKR